jgi:hypothetical protein
MGQAHMHLLIMQSRRVPCIHWGTGKGISEDPQVLLKNEMTVHQVNVSVYGKLYIFVVPLVGC